ncbi:MAG: DUF4397 domain-containing protein, partial [Bacteroidota bacterium]
LISIDSEGQANRLDLVEFANVQLIHNIPNIVVDLYVDDRLIADNVNYRSATSYLELRANRDLILEVKGENSTPASEAILTFDDLRFAALSSSVVVLGGDGTDERPVGVFTFDEARLEAEQTDRVDLAFFHGATDVEPLALSDQQAVPIVSELDFGAFDSYQSFDPTNLVLLAEGGMPLSALDFYGGNITNKAGQTGIVFSSGVVSGSQTFGLFIAFSDGDVLRLDTLDFSRIQMVHNVSNAPDYDVYLNDQFFAGPLAFQAATPYLNIEAGKSLELTLVPTGEVLDSAIFVQMNLEFVEDSTYQVFVNGTPEMPDQPGALFVNDAAREFNLVDFGYDVGLFHGALETGALDFQTSEGSLIGENIAYGQFARTSGLAPANTIVELIESVNQNSLGGFDLPLFSLPSTSSIVVFTSLSAGENPTLELLAVLPDGQVIRLENTAFARLQIVNIVPNPDSPFDVYLDGELIADDLDFRNATAYQTIRAGQDHTIAFAAPNSMDASAALITQVIRPQAEEIIAAFVGLAIDDAANPYQVFLNDRAEIDAGGSNKFTFNFFNGNFDFIDLDLAIQGITTLYRNVSYGSFSNYTLIEPLSSDPLVTFELLSSGNVPYQGDFFADFSAYDNLGATLFASGELSDLANPTMALWIVLPDGTTMPLELIVNTNDLSELVPNMTLSPNPSAHVAYLDFQLEERTSLNIQLMDTNGKLLQQRRLANLNPGNYQEQFNVNELPTGLYFVRLQAAGK